MKTKEQRISEMIGKTYGDIERGTINISFKGELGEVKVICRNRQQVLYTLKRYRKDEYGVMDWVDTVTIINPYKGYVKVNGSWKMRQRIIETKITKKKVQSQELTKKEENQNTVAKNVKEIADTGTTKIYKLIRGRKEKQEIKQEISKQFDKWIKAGDYEINWARRAYKFKGGTAKIFKSKLNMISMVVKNQKQAETSGTWEDTGVMNIKMNRSAKVLVDEFVNIKKFKTLAAMLEYLKRLKTVKAKERQQTQQTLLFDSQRF